MSEFNRTAASFWAVWKEGLDWPELFADEKVARDRVNQLARHYIGQDVHLLRLISQGTIAYPTEAKATGCFT